jgi:hypothetical protein
LSNTSGATLIAAQCQGLFPLQYMANNNYILSHLWLEYL